MLKLLVEHWPREDVVHEGLPTRARREHVLTHVAVAAFYESLGGVVGERGTGIGVCVRGTLETQASKVMCPLQLQLECLLQQATLATYATLFLQRNGEA